MKISMNIPKIKMANLKLATKKLLKITNTNLSIADVLNLNKLKLYCIDITPGSRQGKIEKTFTLTELLHSDNLELNKRCKDYKFVWKCVIFFEYEDLLIGTVSDDGDYKPNPHLKRRK